jgi:serine/threonine protein kinase
MPPGDPALPSEPTRWSIDELIPFGKYILLNKMSGGATAAVYRAKIRGEAGFERLLTVKRILPQMAGDPDFVETFVHEAKICARLNHSNICPIYELGKVGESLYMAMEWVAGKDLGAVARRLEYTGKVMPPLIAAWIAGRLCDALDYAHALKDGAGQPMGIVHQDLSPTNIVISYEGQVKLIDFGLAKAAGRAQQTNVDALKQKIGYMSPELILGTTLDARSDVFGVGVCLYEMVTGRRLFAGTNDIATLKLVSSATVPPPSALIEDTPDDLEVIMMRALARDPDERWQSAGEMAQALTACIASDDPTFGTRHVAEFMRELFAQDMVAEQRRLNELLAASQNVQLLEERRRFFASPLGAAAIAKAETARRMVSTLPPPPKANVATSRKIDRNTPTQVDAVSAHLAADEVTENELTTFRPETKLGQRKLVEPGTPPIAQPAGSALSDEDEPTTFRPEAPPSAPSSEDQFTTLRPSTVAGDNERTTFRPIVGATDTDPLASPEPTDGDDQSSPGSNGHTFEDEATSYFDVQQRASTVRGRAPAIAPKPKFGFEEEATQIFFSQEEGIDLPNLPSPAKARAPEPPVVAPVRSRTASGIRSQHPESTTAAVSAAIRPRLPWPGAGVERGPTLELVAARRSERGPLLWLGLAMLVLTLIGLIVKTPLGITLGMRAPTEGAIEVRTVPPVAAAVKLDGIYRGRAPLRLEGVRTGDRMLALEADGYVTVARHVTVEGGGTASINITLERQPAPSPAH